MKYRAYILPGFPGFFIRNNAIMIFKVALYFKNTLFRTSGAY
uniref:Uncharacterized protein n=1 Tax=Anguilla anguilla TaxID=7936 RepID=A0A0E9RF76_ANGAN